LFYRLKVAAVDLLPLRERPGDILPLVWHFIERYSGRLKLKAIRLAPDAERALLQHPWPGNIRELENVVHHALLVCKDGIVTRHDLHLSSGLAGLAPSAAAATNTAGPGLQALEQALAALYEQAPAQLFDLLEATIIRTAYDHCEQNQVQTGRLLGISRNILRHRLKRYGHLPDGQ
jgi:sigma-54-specific transcriptional regulator